jgi:hypothetical protein
MAFKVAVSRKSWREKDIGCLQLRIATGFKNFLIGYVISLIFQRFQFAS